MKIKFFTSTLAQQRVFQRTERCFSTIKGNQLKPGTNHFMNNFWHRWNKFHGLSEIQNTVQNISFNMARLQKNKAILAMLAHSLFNIFSVIHLNHWSKKIQTYYHFAEKNYFSLKKHLTVVIKKKAYILTIWSVQSRLLFPHLIHPWFCSVTEQNINSWLDKHWRFNSIFNLLFKFKAIQEQTPAYLWNKTAAFKLSCIQLAVLADSWISKENTYFLLILNAK